MLAGWNLSAGRREVFDRTEKLRGQMHGWFLGLLGQWSVPAIEELTGMKLGPDAPATIERDAQGRPKFEIHSARPARRVGPDGQLAVDLVVEITQKRQGYDDPDRQQAADQGKPAGEAKADFVFRGGCTLLLDLETAQPRYFIRKKITSDDRLRRQRRFRTAPDGLSLREMYFGTEGAEPFALLHAEL
jgi:hypothetical protein